MKKQLIVLSAVLCATSFAWSESREDATKRLANAAQVLTAITTAPDKGIPLEVLDHAKCIAVVPHMVKGGFIFGGEGGRGVASCRTATGWSAPAFFTIAGGSWGLQIGVEGVDLVMIVQNQQGMDHWLSSKFQIGGDASAAAGPVGRHASADTDWKMDAEILTYSRAKGVFAGLTLKGNGISGDGDTNKNVYGTDDEKAILTGTVPPTPEGTTFLHSIHHAREAAAASK
ncbi:lipid-binding SYLF domain-containing protein [Terracidiphilus gabretensis]|uniref:lipid-binding SYLF domain-containing protein n=1 Tax=Terracidiphilus gabretensis TaxID=1577687 RepID=UPI00071B4632|nr:lipid-binding SYLF domain-containing protein [Terracidiphilus gabretensis]